jgi:hypothetical protein
MTIPSRAVTEIGWLPNTIQPGADPRSEADFRGADPEGFSEHHRGGWGGDGERIIPAPSSGVQISTPGTGPVDWTRGADMTDGHNGRSGQSAAGASAWRIGWTPTGIVPSMAPSISSGTPDQRGPTLVSDQPATIVETPPRSGGRHAAAPSRPRDDPPSFLFGLAELTDRALGDPGRSSK